MLEAIYDFERYIDNEERHINAMQDFCNLPGVTNTARGNLEIIERMQDLDRYKMELSRLKSKLKQCKCNKLKRLLYGKEIEDSYKLISPGIDSKFVTVYRCKCCDGYYSKSEIIK